MEWMFLFVALLLVAGILIPLGVRWCFKSAPVVYQQQAALLTPSERLFYGALLQAIDSDTVVFSKVRVADLLKPADGLSRSQWQTAFNKVSAKHVDFVLCDSGSLAVKMLIELDDRSHQQKVRISRDEFLNSACQSAKLMLIRVKAQSAYRVEDVRAQIYDR